MLFNEKYKIKPLSLNDERNFNVLYIPKITKLVKKEIKEKYGKESFVEGINIIEQWYDSRWGDQYRFYTINELLAEKQDDIVELLKLKDEVTNAK
jgi:hypothetical protein